MVRALVEYWLRIGPADGIPGRQHFDPVDVWDLIRNIWIVDVVGSPPRFQYRVAGTRIVDYIGQEPTGKTVDVVFPHFPQTESGKDLLRTVNDRVPRWRRGTPTLRSDKAYKTVEQISLPLARDGRTVDMVLNLSVFLNAQGEPC